MLLLPFLFEDFDQTSLQHLSQWLLSMTFVTRVSILTLSTQQFKSQIPYLIQVKDISGLKVNYLTLRLNLSTINFLLHIGYNYLNVKVKKIRKLMFLQ